MKSTTYHNFFAAIVAFAAITIISTSAVESSSATGKQRNYRPVPNGNHHRQNRRRRLRFLGPISNENNIFEKPIPLPTRPRQTITECVLYLKIVELEDGTGLEEWSCLFQNQRVEKALIISSNAHAMMEDDGEEEETTKTTITTTTTTTTEEEISDDDAPKTSSTILDDQFVDIVGISKEVIDSFNPISGATILKIETKDSHDRSNSVFGTTAAAAATAAASQASIAIEEEQQPFIEQLIDNDGNPLDGMKFIIPESTAYVIEKLPENDFRHYKARRRARRRRNLKAADSTGTLRTLVIRVKNNRNGEEPPSSTKLYDDIFADSVCLKSQYYACSKGQLNIEPASEYGSKGIGNVGININPSGNIYGEVMDEIKEQYGSDLEENIDLLIVCQPPGDYDKEWIAFAYVNSWVSYYFDKYCSSVSTLMHEVGHNLGLLHSGADGKEYGDSSGYMGVSYNEDDSPQKCFNAPKNYQLGWYRLQQESWNPHNNQGQKRTWTFNGINDYRTNGSNSNLIVLRLINESQDEWGDYYVGYNTATGPNSGTNEAVNKVMIFQKEGGKGPDLPGRSNKLVELSVGQSYRIRNSLYEAIVEFESRSNYIRDARVSVQVISSNTVCDGRDSGFLTLEITTDAHGSDNTWTITRRSDQRVVASGGPYVDSRRETYVITPYNDQGLCLLPDGEYEFKFIDAYGDGICCGGGVGGFKGTLDGAEIFRGGYSPDSFKDEAVRTFRASKNNPPTYLPPTPTFSPTPAPTPSPTSEPTLPPTPAPVNDEPIQQCVNDINFRYKGNEERKCSWIRQLKKKKKRKKLCKMNETIDGITKKIFLWCETACKSVGFGNCSLGKDIKASNAAITSSCEDDNSKIFNRNKTCKWLLKTITMQAIKWCKKQKGYNACPLTCGIQFGIGECKG